MGLLSRWKACISRCSLSRVFCAYAPPRPIVRVREHTFARLRFRVLNFSVLLRHLLLLCRIHTRIAVPSLEATLIHEQLHTYIFSHKCVGTCNIIHVFSLR